MSSEPLPPDLQQEPLSREQYEESVAAVYLLELQQIQADPWYFIRNYLLTDDPQDLVQPNKPFPDYDYLRWVLSYVHTEQLLAIEKSRQVMITWVMSAYCLWLLLFHPAVRIFIQSKKQEDANVILEEKIMPLWNSMPPWLQKLHPIRFKENLIKAVRSRGSIRAIPQGPGIIRGHTPSLWWSDETCEQSECAETWTAARPALSNKRGKAIFTSSAKPGWFHMLTSDKLEDGVPPPPVDYHELCHGLTTRRLQRNGFCVMRLHYAADPVKRQEEWIRGAKAGMTESAWQQEMEINYDALAGQPALPLFSLYRHEIVCTPFEIPDHWPRWCSIDYGTRSPSSIHLYAVDPVTEVMYCYWEYYRPSNIFEIISVLKDEPKGSGHPDFARTQDQIADHSMFNATQNDKEGYQLKSLAAYMEDEGIYPLSSGKHGDKVKIAAWDYVWLPLLRGKPALFRIFATCPNIIRELPGIVWAEHSDAMQRTRNFKEELVDKNNHAFDDASYILLHRYEDVLGARIIRVIEDKTPEQLNTDAWIARQLADAERTLEEYRQRQEGDGFAYRDDD